MVVQPYCYSHTSALKTPCTGLRSMTTIFASGVTAFILRLTWGRQAWTGQASKHIHWSTPHTASAHHLCISVGKKVRYKSGEWAKAAPSTPEHQGRMCDDVWQIIH